MPACNIARISSEIERVKSVSDQLAISRTVPGLGC